MFYSTSNSIGFASIRPFPGALRAEMDKITIRPQFEAHYIPDISNLSLEDIHLPESGFGIKTEKLIPVFWWGEVENGAGDRKD